MPSRTIIPPQSGRSFRVTAAGRPTCRGAIDQPARRSVTFRAEIDLLLIVTACSVDYYPTNGGICTEIEVEIISGGW